MDNLTSPAARTQRDHYIDRAFALSRAGDILALADDDAGSATLLRAARHLRDLLAFPAVHEVCDRLLKREPTSSDALELKALAMSRMAPKLERDLDSMRRPDRPRTRVVFAGHMVDAPDRPTPRFPAADEPLVASALRAELASLREEHSDMVVYLSGANGGDILFAEACIREDAPRESVPYELFLPSEKDAFIETSVRPAGDAWVERFRRVYERATERVVLRSNLGDWGSNSPYHAVNQWMMACARAYGAENVVIVTLWDGMEGKPGGTADFLSQAALQCAKLIHVRPPRAAHEGAPAVSRTVRKAE